MKGCPGEFASAATLMALNKFKYPSALMAEDGLIEPTSTTGFRVFSVKFKKYAVSSMVFVPCVMTTPSALSLSKIAWIVRNRSSQSESTRA